MKTILRFTVVLFVVNFIAASILAAVYSNTKSKIDEQKKGAQEEALRQVMPESIGDRIEPVEENGEVKYWKAFKGASQKPEAYVFIAKRYGYSSVIETMVGMRQDGTITGVRILSQNETPGLGAKIVELASEETLFKALKESFSKEKYGQKKLLPYFTEQFNGRNVRELELSKAGIHAITGATISSRACVESIRQKGLEIVNAR